MSKIDLLTIEETAQAAQQGWLLSHVYDLAPKRWRVMVLPLDGKSAAAMSTALIGQARGGNTLAQKALGIVMKSNQGT